MQVVPVWERQSAAGLDQMELYLQLDWRGVHNGFARQLKGV